MAMPLAFVLALIGLLAAIAFIGARAGDGPQYLPAVEPAVDLIAYADSEGRIHLVDPEGSQDTMISEDAGFFTWPVWSPDASSLAFSGIILDPTGQSVLEMHQYNLDTGTTTRVYVNSPGMGPILEGMPHYPLWSPDGSKLGIMASERLGLTLLLTEPGLGAPHDVVIRDAPLYAGWSSDSSRLLVHAGAEQYLVNVQEGTTSEPIGIGSTAYRAPAWRAGSNQVAFVSSGALGRQELTVADVVSGDSLVVQPVAATVAFSWSPDGKWLAIGETFPPSPLTYNRVRLVPWNGLRDGSGGSGSVEAITAPVVAFFWSPNSQYIAYVILTDERGVFEWRMHEVDSGTDWPVVEFAPSDEQVTMFGFFDQFSQSHSVWSPRSDAIVFSGVLVSEGVSASSRSQTPTKVLVADALADSAVRDVGTGLLAVWSPR